MEDLDDVLAGVGPRLRSLRQRRGATLAALSEATGVSVSTLSRLESGRRRPTLELLLPLARAHGVQLDELVGAPVTGDPRVHVKPVERNGTLLVPLTRRPGGIRVFRQIIPPGWPGRPLEPRSHEGYDWIFVLEGRLRLVLGDQDLVLREGEVAEFDCRTPHAFANAGDRTLETLSMLGPQGERAHVRARPARDDAGEPAP